MREESREDIRNQEEPILEESTYDPTILYVTRNWSLRLSHFRYVTFLILGVALLWPWNSFLSASAYYGERFSHSDGLAKSYSSIMMTVSTLTSMICFFYLSQVQRGVNYKRRVFMGLNLTMIVFFILAISSVSNSFIRMNDNLFFALLMVLVCSSSVATSLAQNGSIALANVAGKTYANGVMVGQAIAGVLPSISLIISILLVGERGPESAKKKYVEKNYGVFIYFIAASFISILSMASLIVTKRYQKATLYQSLGDPDEVASSTEDDAEEDNDVQKGFVSFGVLWSKLKWIVMGIFFTFCITLVFPVFASSIESKHIGSSFVLFKKDIFIPFVYLVWNIGDLGGRILCGMPNSVVLLRSPKTIFIYSLARVVFIPLFLACRVSVSSAEEGEKALINSDFLYILLQGLFGLTNGQLCTSGFMIVGDHCDTDDEKEAAGGFTTVFLSIGLAAGSVFSYLLVLWIG